MLKHHKNPKVRIRCVDSIYDEGADVVIVVTTRTLDQRMFPPEYKESTRNGERYVKRVLVDQEKVKNKFCAETYRFVFDKQRMLLALSRAEKACFIIGSYELLREDPNWDHVLNLIAENGNLKEQPELLTDSHGRLKTIADDVQRVVDEPIEVIQIDDEGNDMDSSVEISVITTKKPKL
uniref:Uncharacterized protein n=1 Tax=Panagrolaimus sp. JU765 TaxID=591449 RepID=A0AC34QDI1_9BILA